MALTDRRWAFLACAGCAAALIAYWPQPKPVASRPPRLMEPAPEVVRPTLYSTGEQLAVLERRDSILALIRAGRISLAPQPTLVVDPALPPILRSRLATAFPQLVATWQPFAPDVRSLLLVTQAPLFRIADSRLLAYGLWHLHPEATDGRLCLSIALVAPNDDIWGEADLPAPIVRDWVARAMGPCAFYATFGVPGPGVDAWLRSHNDLFAQAADWQGTRPPATLPADFAAGLSLPQLVSLIGRGTPQTRTTPALRGCAAGRRMACDTLLDGWADRSQMTPFGTRYGISRAWPWWSYASEPPWLLADLVRSVGRERFAQFWRSPAPRDEAFRTAVGQDLQQYTHEWLGGRLDQLRVGPRLPAGVIVPGVGLLVLVAALGAVVAMRRQVS